MEINQNFITSINKFLLTIRMQESVKLVSQDLLLDFRRTDDEIKC